MNQTSAEIVRYCREENTFGALLLCGEWGVGKTYLLEHDVAETLGEGFAMLRISLFGEDSVESVRRKVRRAYREQLEALPAERPPEPEAAGKRVILVFDDLERTELSQVEILGCINEYCENLHIKTIVVANEEKLEKLAARRQEGAERQGREFLLYSEMKEKLIVRTVRLEMDHAAVIGSVVRQYRTPCAEYRDFLLESEQALTSLLDDCEIRNIRSLRCGLQDFERVYALCRQEKLTEEETREYLTSFVLFTILAKAGQISRSSLYGYGLNRLQQKYPGHYRESCMPDVLKDSVLKGNWREDAVRAQIRRDRDVRRGTMKPENQLRYLSLPEMDDAIVAEGWSAYLQLAYGGELTPEEYIRLIRNLSAARAYDYRWPETPDAARLLAGAERMCERLCESDTEPESLSLHPDEEELARCSEGERQVYERILAFQDGREYRYGVNRRRLLAAFARPDERELYRCRRLELDRFDEEMAQAALDCWRTLPNNQSRMALADIIAKLLAGCGTEDERTRRGIRKMERSLRGMLDEAAGEPLRQMSVRYFTALLAQREKGRTEA